MDEMRELAAAYALGALDDEERARFEAHLAEGCADCEAEVRAGRETADALARLAPAVQPPRRLHAALLERLEADDAIDRVLGALPPSEVAAGVHFTRADEGEWMSVGLPGITLKRLYENRDDGTTTMLVRMEAGARYPAHRHPTIEQCLVLEGDLHVGEVLLRAGDFQLATPSSEHAPHWTETGCTIFLVASETPEII
jgi:anti-sigma factor ChrR (cupin superfamily)